MGRERIVDRLAPTLPAGDVGRLHVLFFSARPEPAVKKATAVPATITAYIAMAPAAVRPALRRLRDTIAKAAPEAEEAIRYRMPTFIWHGNLVHFAVFDRHIGFYPTPSAIVRFVKELAAYPTSKGAVQFPLDEPLPLPLVDRIVRFRIAETGARLSAAPAAKKTAAKKPAARKRAARSEDNASARSGRRR